MIDSHVHVIDPGRIDYPWLADPLLAPINRPFLPDDLAPVLRADGVKAAILVRTRSSLEESEEFLAHVQAHPWLAGVVAWADLTTVDFVRQLGALRAAPGGNKLVGIRHQVQDEPDDHWLLRQDVHRGLAVLDDHSLTFDLLVKPQHLGAAIQTVRRFPSPTFVLDHIAKPPIASGQTAGWAEQISTLAQLPNVFCKVSGMVTEADWQHSSRLRAVCRAHPRQLRRRTRPVRVGLAAVPAGGGIRAGHTDSGKFRSVYGIFPSGASATQCGFRELEERLVGFQTLRKWTESVSKHSSRNSWGSIPRPPNAMPELLTA